MRVMIVDDNVELRDFLCLSLGELQIEAVGLSGESGADAISQRVEDEDFDVVVVDSVLSASDGISLMQCVRRGEKGRAIPIVLVSEIGTGLARRIATNAGATQFLAKPFGLTKFATLLRELA